MKTAKKVDFEHKKKPSGGVSEEELGDDTSR